MGRQRDHRRLVEGHDVVVLEEVVDLEELAALVLLRIRVREEKWSVVASIPPRAGGGLFYPPLERYNDSVKTIQF